jgi:hypothetical protein
MPHRHTITTILTRPFVGAVTQRQNVAAHGCVTEVQTCSCGAVRAVNINGRHVERGSWSTHDQQ